MRRSITLAVSLLGVAGCPASEKPAAEANVAPAPEVAAKPKPKPTAATPAPEAPETLCDADGLRVTAEAITKQWDTWSPRSGLTLDLSLEATSAVWNHCPGLPDGARRMLDLIVEAHAPPLPHELEGRPAPAVAVDPLDAKFPDHARVHALALDEAWSWRASVCDDYQSVADAMAEVAAAQRREILWDLCLTRFDFVTREEFVAEIHEWATVGFALYDWLTVQAHVAPALAKPLARAIVLSGHWLVRPEPGLLLPWAVAGTGTKIDDGTVLELRPDAIALDGRVIASLDATGKLDSPPEAVPGRPETIVLPLFDLLAEEVDKSTMIAERSGVPQPATLLLVAHRALPWSLVRPVLGSAKVAGFDCVALVVLVDDRADPLRALTLYDAATRESPELADTTSVQALVDELVAR